ncbi:MAG: SDR family oxidoreductase [Bacteriovoracia bacterium]
MEKRLNHKVIVITGASAGVGRGIAQVLAKRGAKLGLIARGEDKLESTVREVEELGGKALACVADVSDYDALEEAAQKIENKFGPIDIWINNAMVTMLGKVQDIQPDEVKHVMDVNYMGSVNGVKIAAKRFLPRNKGHIIQIGSALAFISIPLQSAYCASKHAVTGFLQSFRIELKIAKSKIKLTEVHLPAVNTPQFEWMKNYMPEHPMPVPPIFEPEVIGKAVSFLIDHPRRAMWVGGPTVKSILGAKFAPWIAEWKLARSGIQSQQTELAPPTHQTNLWEPLPVDYGATGIFDEKAKDRSWQLLFSMNRNLIAGAGVLAIGVGLFLNKKIIRG